MIPPAIVSSKWALHLLGLFQTLYGMILIHIAYSMSFSALFYRSFIASIPREIDEAAFIDDTKPWQIFLRII